MIDRVFSSADSSFLLAARYTGLSYELLNILFYCLLVPALWSLIAGIRMQSPALPALFAVVVAGIALFAVQASPALQNEFYARNLRQLHHWASLFSETYRTIAVWIGVAGPAAAALCLAFLPRRFLYPGFALAILLLCSVLLSAWFLY